MFKPLAGDVPTDAQDHVVYDLMDQTSSLPTGSVTITKVVDDDDDDTSMLLWVGVLLVIILVIVAAAVLARSRSE
jgi:hypothetical protein